MLDLKSKSTEELEQLASSYRPSLQDLRGMDMTTLSDDALQDAAKSYEDKANLVSQFGTAGLSSVRSQIGGIPGVGKMFGDWMANPPSMTDPVTPSASYLIPGIAQAEMIRRTGILKEPGKKLASAGQATQDWITQPIPGFEPQKYDFKDRPFMELARIAGSSAPFIATTYGGAGALKAAGMAPEMAALTASFLSQFPQQATETYDEQMARGIDHDTARNKALAVAGIISAIESIPAAGWLEGYGGANKLIKGLKGAIQEGSEEVAQAAVSLASRLSYVQSREDISNALMQFSQEAKEGFVGGAMLGGPMGAVSPLSTAEVGEEIREGTISRLRKSKDIDVMGIVQPAPSYSATDIAKRTARGERLFGYLRGEESVPGKTKEVQRRMFNTSAGPAIQQQVGLLREAGVGEGALGEMILKHGARLREVVDSLASGQTDPAHALVTVMKLVGREAFIDYSGMYDKMLDERKGYETELESLRTIPENEQTDETKKRVKWLEGELSNPVSHQKMVVDGKNIIIPTMSNNLAKAYHVARQLGQNDAAEKIIERYIARSEIRDQKTGRLKRISGVEDIADIGQRIAEDWGLRTKFIFATVKFKSFQDLLDAHLPFGYTPAYKTGTVRILNYRDMATRASLRGKILSYEYRDLNGQVHKSGSPLIISVPPDTALVVLHIYEQAKPGPAITDNTDYQVKGTTANMWNTLVHEIAHDSSLISPSAHQAHGAPFRKLWKDIRKKLFVKTAKAIGEKSDVAVAYTNEEGREVTIVVKGAKALRELLDVVGERVHRIGILEKMELGTGADKKKGIPVQRRFVYGDEISDPEALWGYAEEIPFELVDESGQTQFAFDRAVTTQAKENVSQTPTDVSQQAKTQGDLFSGNQFRESANVPPVVTTPDVTEPVPPQPRRGPGGKVIPMNLNLMDIEHMRYLDGAFAWGSNNGRSFEQVWQKFIGTQFRANPLLRRFLGIYYSRLGPNGRIVVKDITNLRTLCHEVGHFVDDYYAKNRGLLTVPRGWDTVMRQELVAVSSAMRGPFARDNKYRNSRSELIADLYSMYVLDEAQARRLAPSYFAAVIDPMLESNPEFQYIATKLRELQQQLGPLAKFVESLAPVKEFDSKGLRDMTQEHHGRSLLEVVYPWNRRVRAYKMFTHWFDKLLHTNDATKLFSEKAGLTNAEFMVFHQFRKLLSGALATVKEEISEPLTKQSPEVQQRIAEILQDWNAKYGTDPEHPLWILTEKTRTELARWANALRKVGVLNDMVFWNHVGRYFPYMYTAKELAAQKASPYSKKILADIRANTKWKEARMSNELFAQKGIAMLFDNAPMSLTRVLHSMWPERFGNLREFLGMEETTVPIGAVQTAILDVLRNKESPQYSPLTKSDYEALGMRMRDDMGLIKTAAYPVHKRLGQLIKTYYRIKVCDALASIPSVEMKSKLDPHAVKMSDTKTNGGLAGKYVRDDVFNMLQGFDQSVDKITEVILGLNAMWKTFKVPLNTGSYVTNNLTNLILMWMHDIPVFANPTILANGVQQFTSKGEIYRKLRDAGLFSHTYGEEELAAMATMAEKYKNNGRMLYSKALEMMAKPGRAYGFFEDMGKTVIATYYMKKGASIDEAVLAADKILFDYSSTSKAVQMGKKGFLPFITWSAKVAPRIVETGILRPEKYIAMMALWMVVGSLMKAMHGVSDEEERKTKPDYLKGHMTIVVGRDNMGNPIYIDLDKYMPWGTWKLQDLKGGIMPQALTAGGIPIIILSATIFNRDPWGGDIVKEWMTPAQATKARMLYVMQSVLPEWAGRGAVKVVEAAQGKAVRPGEEATGLSSALTRTLLGIPTGKTTAITRGKSLQYNKRKLSEGRSTLLKQLATGRITKEQYEKEYRALYAQFEKYLKGKGIGE